MRLPQVRFTVRQMMFVVAIVALAMGCVSWCSSRAARFDDLANQHYRASMKTVGIEPDTCNAFSTPRSIYHEEMAKKYAYAYRKPWLPVAPDPPEPE